MTVFLVKLTFSFSTKSTKVVLSISTGWPCLSYKASTKWKKLDLRRLEGGCFSKCARASPTPLQAQAQKPAPSTKNSQLKFMFLRPTQRCAHPLWKVQLRKVRSITINYLMKLKADWLWFSRAHIQQFYATNIEERKIQTKSNKHTSGTSTTKKQRGNFTFRAIATKKWNCNLKLTKLLIL